MRERKGLFDKSTNTTVTNPLPRQLDNWIKCILVEVEVHLEVVRGGKGCLINLSTLLLPSHVNWTSRSFLEVEVQ